MLLSWVSCCSKYQKHGFVYGSKAWILGKKYVICEHFTDQILKPLSKHDHTHQMQAFCERKKNHVTLHLNQLIILNLQDIVKGIKNQWNLQYRSVRCDNLPLDGVADLSALQPALFTVMTNMSVPFTLKSDLKIKLNKINMWVLRNYKSKKWNKIGKLNLLWPSSVVMCCKFKSDMDISGRGEPSYFQDLIPGPGPRVPEY